jgi:hypothetical protein
VKPDYFEYEKRAEHLFLFSLLISLVVLILGFSLGLEGFASNVLSEVFGIIVSVTLVAAIVEYLRNKRNAIIRSEKWKRIYHRFEPTLRDAVATLATDYLQLAGKVATPDEARKILFYSIKPSRYTRLSEGIERGMNSLPHFPIVEPSQITILEAKIRTKFDEFNKAWQEIAPTLDPLLIATDDLSLLHYANSTDHYLREIGNNLSRLPGDHDPSVLLRNSIMELGYVVHSAAGLLDTLSGKRPSFGEGNQPS